MTVRKSLFASLALAAGLATSAAHAGGVNWSIGINLPAPAVVAYGSSYGPVYAPAYGPAYAPAYVAPPVIYAPPPPPMVVPRVVYAPPLPVPMPGWYAPHGYRHWHGDGDRDGYERRDSYRHRYGRD